MPCDHFSDMNNSVFEKDSPETEAPTPAAAAPVPDQQTEPQEKPSSVSTEKPVAAAPQRVTRTKSRKQTTTSHSSAPLESVSATRPSTVTSTSAAVTNSTGSAVSIGYASQMCHGFSQAEGTSATVMIRSPFTELFFLLWVLVWLLNDMIAFGLRADLCKCAQIGIGAEL